MGWGVHLGGHIIQGKWSVQEYLLHINFLELRAVRNTYIHFLQLIRDKSIKVVTDNVVCMLYISCQSEISFSLYRGNEVMELVCSQ